MPSPLIRPLAPQDRAQWGRLWTGYLAFYETVLPPAMHDLAFARMLSHAPETFDGLVAEQEGRLVGLAHYLFHAHGWQRDRACYLQDLYAAPKVRGTGIGRALIEAVYASADAAGAPHVHWMTETTNVTARQLYDRIGAQTPFIEYQRPE